MTGKSYLIRIFALILIFTLTLPLCSCIGNNTYEEYGTEAEDEMPDFKYIVFPILDQAQITLEKIFCTVEYSNRTVSLNGIEYHYVEKKEYEDESFESQLLGVFTPEYAEEYTEMMYSGDEPLYIDSDGDLYVNPLLLNEYTKSEYDRDAVYLTSYNEEESAAVRVTDEGGNVHNYELKMIDGIWYLNCKFDFLNF